MQRPRFVAVLMAGGRGQRFWPLSTDTRPKQFLDLEGTGRTLLQSTFDRVLPLVTRIEDVYVATAATYASLVAEQLPEIAPGNILVEPVGRDSAPAIALASLHIHARTGGAICGIFSTDHRVAEPQAFRAAVRTAIDVARTERGLVTLGIQPDRPATGYGYIETGPEPGPAFTVRRFVEKPDLETARRYLASGRFLWNAGIFVWHTAAILEELAAHAPDLMGPLASAYADDAVAARYGTLPKISIDYAVMERTNRAFVVPGDFGWDDIGDWVALERLQPGWRAGLNTVVGRHAGIDTRGVIVYSEGDDDLIVTLGVEDLIIVKRGKFVLLAAKSRVADIKMLLGDASVLQAIGAPEAPSHAELLAS